MSCHSAIPSVLNNLWFANSTTASNTSHNAFVSGNSVSSSLSYSRGASAHNLTVGSSNPRLTSSPCRTNLSRYYAETAAEAQFQRCPFKNKISLTIDSTKRRPDFKHPMERNSPSLTWWQAQSLTWTWRSQFNWVFMFRLFPRHE